MSTPAETIQAAIDKLTRLRDEADRAPWVSEPDATYPQYRIVFSGDDPLFDPGDYAQSSATTEEPNASLIVVLHATIDAQLLIMRNELEEIAIDKEASGFERPPHHDVFTLARAILGEQVNA